MHNLHCLYAQYMYKIKNLCIFLFLSLFVWCFFCVPFSMANEVLPAKLPSVVVFAAASTRNALEEVKLLYKEKMRQEGYTVGEDCVQFSFASSSTLARQIEHGAPAHIFLSANTRWMDYVADCQRIRTDTRQNLLKNTLVVIESATIPQTFSEDILTKNGAKELFGRITAEQRLALGNPDHVPAGIYAKDALTYYALWEGLTSYLVPAKDVRAALAFVERGETPLGIVYATDAAITDKVRVVTTFAPESHSAIVYPVAAMTTDTATQDAAQEKATNAFLHFLLSDTAEEVWSRWGFSSLKE